MRGHIVKRYKNSYTIVLNMGKDPTTGKPVQQWISVKGDKKEAEQRLTELLRQLDTGTFVKPGKTTVAEYLKSWIEGYEANVAPRTFERYQGIIMKHVIPTLGRLTVTRLRPEHIQNLYAVKSREGLAPRSINQMHSVIHKAMETAIKRGLLYRNPADGVDPPRIPRLDMQVWDEDDINRFLEVAQDSPYYEFYFLAIYTGMRRSELLALRWSDIDFLYCQLYVSRGMHRLKNGRYIFTEPKTERSRRTIALSPSVILVLKDYREKRERKYRELDLSFDDSELIFQRSDGSPIRPNTVTRAWNDVIKKAGVKPVRLHDARHSHATIMLKAGVHPKIVQERLGHSSISMTLDIYSTVLPGLQEAAAEKFDNIIRPKITPENRVINRVD
ncbi:MAG: site-specific integrase [Dehalococcoidales bacterium]|nr:site-specific integrase [Dehalococcoidales bacterium]